jgi:hypothetical protein
MLQRREEKALRKVSLDWLFRQIENIASAFLSSLNALSPWSRTLTSWLSGFPSNSHPSNLSFGKLLLRLQPIHPSTHPPARPTLQEAAIASATHPPAHLLLLLFLCFSLTGCSFFNSGPSTAAVEQAIAQKLVQTQGVLRSQLSTEESSSKPFQVGKVSVSRQHKVMVGQQAAVEVEGTYTLKGGTLSRSQRQQQRPFDLYLQRGAETDQWLLLEPDVS